MATHYHIYAGDTSGGPIDYGTIVDTVAGLTWTTGVLAANTRQWIGVRAFDTASGLEESNVDCRVLIALDASQVDVTGLPPAPTSVQASPLANGGFRVEWTWPYPDRPTGFKVYLGTPSPSYGSPVATVPSMNGLRNYRFDGTGLADGVPYQVVVRAYNAIGTEANADVAGVTGDASPPADVDYLTATATTQA